MKNINSFFLMLITALIFLSCCRKITSLTPTPKGFQGDVWYFNMQNPILKGLDINPLSKISVRMPYGQGGNKLQKMQLSISNPTVLKDIKKN